MKNYIYKLFIILLAVGATSCADDEGTEPGNDKEPVITIYQYKASRPLDVDNDISLRFAVNNKTTEAYYFMEKTIDRDARIASIGEEGYKDYVISNGVKLSDISSDSDVAVIKTEVYGKYTITAVALGGGKRNTATLAVSRLVWNDVTTGTYTFSKPKVTGIGSTTTTLQICTTDKTLFRFKDLYGKGYHLKINLIDQTKTDEDGKYTFFRIPVADTSFKSSKGSTVNVRDIGYWQGNDAYVTENGYESGMYADHSCFLCIQYYSVDGSLGYGYDKFVPN